MRTAARCVALLVAGRQRSDRRAWRSLPRCQSPKISWRVDNSFRFFSDAADTEVHRATLSRAAARRSAAASDPRRRAGAERPARGWLGGDHVPRHVLGRAHQPLRLQRRRQLHQSEIAPHRASASTTSTRRPASRCTWLTAPLGGDAARRRRHAAVQRGGALRHSLSGRRDGQRRDRRTRGGEREGRRQGSAHRRHGRQLRFGRRQSGRAGALFARPQRRLRRALGGQRSHRLSGAHRPVEADRRQAASSRRTPAGSTRAATARFIRISCAPPCSSASRTTIAPSPTSALRARVRRSPSASSCSMPATNGCPTRPTCRKFRPSLRRSAMITRRRCRICPKPITWTAPSPS